MATKLKFYGYPKCTTCKRAQQWLDDRGIAYEYIDITEKPPAKQTLRGAMRQGGYSLRQLFNTSGQQYRQQGIKECFPEMSEQEALELLSQNGKLCKRPFVTDGSHYTVGFKEATYEEVWGQALSEKAP